MKQCIWCLSTEEKVTFKKKAHTIPQTLGGTKICSNVCDECNLFFGSHSNKLPPIETVIKETFNISRARLLEARNEIGKNKTLPKFSSIYFNLDLKKGSFSLKASYRNRKNFQEGISRQLKKGLYKIFLEETERQKRNGLDSQFDFIREFCRYDLGDYPIFYFERNYGIIIMADSWAIEPVLIMEEEMQFKYLVREPSFFEFELLGHVFGIATSRHWELVIDNYIKKTSEAKSKHFKRFRQITNFSDIDLALSIIK
ncbi:MAG: HNH endonuclease [Bacteroidia bacterium]